MENAFYLMLKALLVLTIFKSLSGRFCHAVFIFMTLENREKIITAYFIKWTGTQIRTFKKS